jgi:hypothetical protein
MAHCQRKKREGTLLEVADEEPPRIVEAPDSEPRDLKEH